jgi:hypothetical protein
MYPSLVEPTIKVIMKQQLNVCNKDKFQKNSLVLNLVIGFIILFIISVILYIKYKGKQDIKTIKERERKKKEYILSKINNYQKMKNKNLIQ